MDSYAALVRLKEFEIEADRRRVSQIQTMVTDFTRRAAELDREIQAEESRSGITDPTHYAYPTYAMAARQRSDNLRRSIAELKHQFDTANRTLTEAVEELEAAVAPGRRRPTAGTVNANDRARNSAPFGLDRAS